MISNMRITTNSPRLLEYDIVPGARAFSTMRYGGVGKGEYSGFNINRFCGDSAENVAANRLLLARCLGIDTENIILPHQTHGTDFRIVDRAFLALSDTARCMKLEGIDGLLTSVKGVCIGVSTADCIPVIIYDTVRHAACVAHAGWRGTVKRIAQKAVAEMQSVFRSDPSNMKAVVGPGISLDSFEVGDEVYEQFRDAGFDMQAMSAFHDKWHIDLHECNRRQLAAAGVPDCNIDVVGIDTFTSSDFFSARRQGISSGRIYTAIILE